MTHSLNAPSPPRRDPRIIDRAPTEPDFPASTPAGEVDFARVNAQLAETLAATEAERDRLKGRQTVDQVRASLIRPYANKVFWFVAIYCGMVGVMLVLAGWRTHTGFQLSDAILGIIAGSTAVSVIGLIGMVISGLFGSSRTPPQ
jgi:hypothetical protein